MTESEPGGRGRGGPALEMRGEPDRAAPLTRSWEGLRVGQAPRRGSGASVGTLGTRFERQGAGCETCSSSEAHLTVGVSGERAQRSEVRCTPG